MKIEQQTIEEIQNQFKGIGVDYTNNKDITAIAVVHGEGAEATIKALEKQIPKKPIRVSDNRTDGCPECKTEYYEAFKYCPGCGQRMDWE